MQPQPHPLNVPGDFYVEENCCTMCDVPRVEAPELFALTAAQDHCYVCRQPQTDGELEQMLSAISLSEVHCICYRGSSPAVITRLSAMGQMEVCDTSPPAGTELGLRTHVTFSLPVATTPATLAASFRQFLRAQLDKYFRVSFPWFPTGPTVVKYKLRHKDWCVVHFEHHQNFLHVSHAGWEDAWAITTINWWLASLEQASEVRWYTQTGWSTTGVWHSSSM